MAVSLSKGGSVSLSREAGASPLTSVTVGLGWDKAPGTGAPFDLDVSAILLDARGKALSDADFVFYGNLRNPTGAVVHGGDNLDGEGDGDDETISINLAALPSAVQAVVIIASIDAALERGQSFGNVANASIRVSSDFDQRELARFDLADGADSDIALAFGELYRDGGEWKFCALGEGYPEGLGAAIANYGVEAK